MVRRQPRKTDLLGVGYCSIEFLGHRSLLAGSNLKSACRRSSFIIVSFTALRSHLSATMISAFRRMPIYWPIVSIDT
jgi:hypothetical protein